MQDTDPTAGQSVGYSYDERGNRTVMTATAGSQQLVTSYSYDAANRLKTVANPTHFTGQAVYDYDPVGLRKKQTLPNGVVVDYIYDEINRLKSVVQTNAGGTTLGSYAYQLGPAGNRTKVTELGGSSIEWGYDDSYRLTGETRKDSGGSVITSTNYTYDKTGNRLKQTTGAQTTNYSYNELDQLMSVLAGGLSTGYSYDRRGNLTSVTGGTSYSWDATDRMTGATVPGGGSASYTYDADNRRVKQVSGGTTTTYLWDEQSRYGDVALETDSANNITASYVLGAACACPHSIQQLISQKRNAITNYYLYDAQDSIRSLLDSNANITARYSYAAFGEITNSVSPTITSHLYTGQQFDSLTQLYSLRARYYSPNNGRFLTRDLYKLNLQEPIELNRYIYATNSPINLKDPSGFTAEEYGSVTLQTGGKKELSPSLAWIGNQSFRYIAGLGVFSALVVAEGAETIMGCIKQKGPWFFLHSNRLCLGLGVSNLGGPPNPFAMLAQDPKITVYNEVWGDGTFNFAPQMLILMFLAKRIYFDMAMFDLSRANASPITWETLGNGWSVLNPNITNWEFCTILTNPAFLIKTEFLHPQVSVLPSNLCGLFRKF